MWSDFCVTIFNFLKKLMRLNVWPAVWPPQRMSTLVNKHKNYCNVTSHPCLYSALFYWPLYPTMGPNRSWHYMWPNPIGNPCPYFACSLEGSCIPNAGNGQGRRTGYGRHNNPLIKSLDHFPNSKFLLKLLGRWWHDPECPVQSIASKCHWLFSGMFKDAGNLRMGRRIGRSHRCWAYWVS